jgi:uncharacterized membrane protein YcaP (DUF421 family)
MRQWDQLWLKPEPIEYVIDLPYPCADGFTPVKVKNLRNDTIAYQIVLRKKDETLDYKRVKKSSDVSCQKYSSSEYDSTENVLLE